MDRVRSPMLDQTLYEMSDAVEWHIGLVVEFDGRLDEARLRRTLALSIAAAPLLGGRFVPGRWRTYWEWPAEFSEKDLLAVEERRIAEPANHAFFVAPMDFKRGPQLRALLLRGATDALLLKVTHYATDAGGLKVFAYLLAETYRRLADDANFAPPASERPRGLRQIADRFTLSGKWRIVRRGVREVRENPTRPHPLTPPGRVAPPDERRYIIRHIAPAPFRALVAWSRPRGLTINDVLIAGLLRALACVSPAGGERLLRLIATADLRRYLPEGEREVIANLSGWVYACFGRELGADLETTARLVGAKMRSLKDDTLGLSMMPTLLVLARCLPLRGSRALLRKSMQTFSAMNAFPPSLTNMGPIDAARLDFGQPAVCSAYLIVPLIYPPTFGAGVSGFRDTLTLTSGYCGVGVDEAVMNALFDAWLDELPS